MDRVHGLYWLCVETLTRAACLVSDERVSMFYASGRHKRNKCNFNVTCNKSTVVLPYMHVHAFVKVTLVVTEVDIDT